jgi:hypothetical protein
MGCICLILTGIKRQADKRWQLTINGLYSDRLGYDFDQQLFAPAAEAPPGLILTAKVFDIEALALIRN